MENVAKFFSNRAPHLQHKLLERQDTFQKLHAKQPPIKPTSSWLIEWWNSGGYMQPRDSVVLNVSYFFQFIDDPFRSAVADRSFNSEIDGQLSRAANLIRVALDWRHGLLSGKLPPDHLPKRPDSLTCMEMYKYLFNTCRIPQTNIDQTFFAYNGGDKDECSSRIYPHDGTPSFNSIVRCLSEANDSAAEALYRYSHVIVIHKGHIYKMNCCSSGENKGIYSERVLINRLKSIRDHASSLGWAYDRSGNRCNEQLADKTGVSLLTAENRDVWADHYNLLAKSSPESLSEIQTAAFVVCLDSEDQRSTSHADDRLNFSSQVWHAGDYARNNLNRWYDKPQQLVVTSEGKAGLVVEHSGMDATVALRCWDEVIKKCLKHGNDEPTLEYAQQAQVLPSDSDSGFTSLFFWVDPSTKDQIPKSIRIFQNDLDRQDHHIERFSGFGAKHIKSILKQSPDSLVQVAMQLAYFKLFGVCRPTYESASTRRYSGGRTETGRSMSVASVEFCESMRPEVNEKHEITGESSFFIESIAKREGLSLSKDNVMHVRAHLLIKSLLSQSENMRQCSQAQGTDRHLLGLRMISSEEPENERTMDEMQMFNDKWFKNSNHWYLSTSQVGSTILDGWGWGQVAPEGYGVAYLINDNWINFNVACLKRGPGLINPDLAEIDPVGVKYLDSGCKEFGKPLTKPAQTFGGAIAESIRDIDYILQWNHQNGKKAKL